MLFVYYGNFPSYCYRALLVITCCYGARVYANQYMQFSAMSLRSAAEKTLKF